MKQHLLIDSQSRTGAFGRFCGELLIAEGLTGFTVSDIAADPMPVFSPDDVIVLARAFPTDAQIQALHTAVEQGAGLAVLHPTPRLMLAFDCRPAPSATHPGWLAVDEGLPGAGCPIQTHVPIGHVDEVALSDDWQTLAYATDAQWPDTPAERAAVLMNKVGAGHVVFFMYDLAKAVARIRFGDVDLVDVVANGHWKWLHACDLFTGHVDPRVSHLPQADFHSQLLAEVLTRISAAPLARLWYYPRAADTTTAIVQSDDDWSTPQQFEALSSAVEKRGGTATYYMMEDTLLPDEQLIALRDKGHTFGPHVNVFKPNQNIESFDDNYLIDQRENFEAAMARQTDLFRKRYGPCSATLQSHCAPWAGYMDLVPIHIEHGYRLLFAYLSGPQSMINQFMCGSGRPLPFCDEDGLCHDCWQQPVTTYDDESLRPRIASDPASVVAEFSLLFDDAVARTHTPFVLLSHPVSFAMYSHPFIEACLDCFAEAGAPIINADAWLTFQDRRRGATLQQTMRDEKTLQFSLSSARGPLCLMVPVTEKPWQVTVAGQPLPTARMTRLGRDYQWIDLPPTDDDTPVTVQLTSPAN